MNLKKLFRRFIRKGRKSKVKLPGEFVDLDWEVLRRCKYPVPGMSPTYETDCDEPASIEVSWYDPDEPDFNLGKMVVCQKHFDIILITEAKSVESAAWEVFPKLSDYESTFWDSIKE